MQNWVTGWAVFFGYSPLKFHREIDGLGGNTKVLVHQPWSKVRTTLTQDQITNNFSLNSKALRLGVDRVKPWNLLRIWSGVEWSGQIWGGVWWWPVGL